MGLVNAEWSIAILDYNQQPSKMPHLKKKEDFTLKVPNYSDYDCTESIQVFTETDRLSESNLCTLECYQDYELKASLNSFSDRLLNDHLYMLYKHKQLETPCLMQKLVSFFIRCYENQLEPMVHDYSESKKKCPSKTGSIRAIRVH